MNIIDKKFVEDFLIAKNGNLNPRALEKYNVTKELAYQAYMGLNAPAKCKQCQSPVIFLSFQKGYRNFCSNQCVGKNKDIVAKKRSTLESNYGTDGFKSEQIRKKVTNTNIEKYGVEHLRQDPQYVELLKQNYLLKYGTTSPATTESANKKRTATNIEKYGTANPVSNSSVYEKIKQTNLEKYGVSTTLLLQESRNKALESRRDFDVYAMLDDPNWLELNKHIPSTLLSEKYNIAWSTILNYYKKHQVTRPNVIVSRHELVLIEFLEQYGVRCEVSNRTILNGKEIDIFLPDYNIGIEIDGLYWHSEQFKNDKFYHTAKSELANKKNIHLIHITDSELTTHTQIVYNRLLAKLGLAKKCYARKCTIVEVDNSTYNKFMSLHHIQGTAVASVRLGLIYQNKLVAVMSFSKSRYNKKYQWELIRYASDGTVVGGASKILVHFIKTYDPKSIISYSDSRWNSGKLYTSIGMIYDHTSPPNYWYIVNGQLKHRSGYQKHKLKNKLTIFDENKSERENMENNNYLRYWDCGNKVYVWNKDKA